MSRKLRIVGFCLLLGVIGFSSALAADWPKFMGPTNDNWTSPETGLNKNWSKIKPKILWKINLSDNGYASPAIVQGVLYIIDHQGKNDVVRAVDMKTGKDVWQYTYEEPARFYWGYSYATPTFDNGKLYTVSKSGFIHCLEAATGKNLCDFNIIKKLNGELAEAGMTPSPLIDGDKLIVCPGGKSGVAALNKNTGEVIWQGGNGDQPYYASPMIVTLNNKKQYLVFTGVSLLGIEPENGQVLWRYPWETPYGDNAPNPLVIGDDQVFITSFIGCTVLRIEKDWSVTKVWESATAIATDFSCPVFYNGYIYGNKKPNLICLNSKTGEIMWKQPAFGVAPLMMVDGVILGFNAGGDLVMIQPNTSKYQEIGRFPEPLGKGEVWNPPVLSDGKLIIRNKKTLACIELKK